MHNEAGLAAYLPEQKRKKVRLILASIVVPLAILTVLGMIYLWPNTMVDKRPVVSVGSEIVSGTISQIGALNEYGTNDVQMILKGHEVAVPLSVPAEIVANGLEVGDKVQAIFSASAVGSGVPYLFYDFERQIPLTLLGCIYFLAVLLVAGRKGLAAMIGLFTSLAVVAFFMLPALLAGSSPFLVVIVGAMAMMFSSIYFAHGVSIRTTTAILGTFAGLVITGLTAWFTIGQANLTGTLNEASVVLFAQFPQLSLQQILLAGMLLAGLGALNDVTITQVSTVWELHAANRQVSRSKLIKQGMIVGRDHIASTVYTLAFAYIGTALPLLLAASLLDRGFIDLLLVGEIAEEIVRTLVASIGLVLAIPLTTVIAAVLAPVSPARNEE